MIGDIKPAVKDIPEALTRQKGLLFRFMNPLSTILRELAND